MKSELCVRVCVNAEYNKNNNQQCPHTHTHTHMSSHFSFVLFNLLSTYSSRACIMDEGVKYAGDSGKKHMRN